MALGATAATAATAAEAAVPSSSRPSQLLRPPREAFDESLLVRPLDASGSLLVFLNLSVSVAGRDWRHLELFPRAAAELVLASEAREAHLSLTSGRWLQEEWGVPPEPAPLGSALWAWLPAPSAVANIANGEEPWPTEHLVRTCPHMRATRAVAVTSRPTHLVPAWSS